MKTHPILQGKDIILCGLFLISITGCNTLSKWTDTLTTEVSSGSMDKKSFQINTSWVKRSTNTQNMGVRKINRFSPILYDHPQKGELLIQANSMDGIAAYQRTNGQEVWRFKLINGIESSAFLLKDQLFFGGEDGQFYSINASTGEVLWSFPTRMENLSEPLVQDGIVYFLSGNNSLYALDAVSGKQLWMYTRQDPGSFSIRGGSKPILSSGVLYCGFSDGAIVALNAINGTIKWEKQLNRNKKFRDLDSDPLIEGDRLYIFGYDDQVYSLKASSGEIIWKYGRGGYGSFLSTADRLYFPSSSGEFISLSKESGQKIWSYTLKREGGTPTAGALYKGLVVFGESQGDITFLDAGTGRWVGGFTPGRGIMARPTVDEKTYKVYFISGEANLYALDARWDWPQRISYLEKK